jgi:hypothetical protein
VTASVHAPDEARASSRLARLVRRADTKHGEALASPIDEGPRPAAGDACELCAEPLPAGHRHLLELDIDRLRCVCTPCALLFDRRQAGLGRFRPVPDRVRRIADFELDDERWTDFSIPVGLAYLVESSRAGRVRGFYPGAMGAVESRLGLEAWTSLVDHNPVLRSLEPDVEALLIRRLPSAEDYWTAPLDACYELVAILRTRWRGFTGGEQVWRDVDRFFVDLAGRAQPITRHGVRIASRKTEDPSDQEVTGR